MIPVLSVPEMATDLMSATVQLEQPLPDGSMTVATGFLVNDPTPDGRPRIVLVTANHVFAGMPGDQAQIGYRVKGADGAWTFAPASLPIRAHGKPLWRKNPNRDVAVIAITAPAEFAKAAIPLAWIAGDDSLSQSALAPGEEMMTLGYPQGLSANPAGFPILRTGRVASYPVGPSSISPTFLLDFPAFPGNSGGPVWLEGANEPNLVAGILTQQVEKGGEPLGIGVVVQAQFIRDTISQLDAPAGAAPAPTQTAVVTAPSAASNASAVKK
jgi:S1-C subfamily serine protease